MQSVNEHRLKCWPPYFRAVATGDKLFEVRLDDRGFQRGDVLILELYDPEQGGYQYNTDDDLDSRGDTLICLYRRISYVLTGGQFGIEPGYVVLGLQEE